MANRRSDRLQGWADPEDPRWRENLMARVRKTQSEKARKHRTREASVQVFFDMPFKALLQRAAQARGMSIGSYARRAIGARIARDLGLSLSEVMRHCAAVVPYGSHPTGKWLKENSFDDGRGYGDW